MEILVVKMTCNFCAATENNFKENRITDPTCEHDKLISHTQLWTLGQEIQTRRPILITPSNCTPWANLFYPL